MAHSIISISDSQVNGADQVLVADSNSKIPAVDGSQLTLLNATTVTSGTIASARLDVGTTANKLIQLDGTAKLPAVDASQLTGIVSATISASDPTISTNPSGGVGTEWNNSTTGKMYICTDATAGANVWKNVGGGSGDVEPFEYGGLTYGYVSGGYAGGPYNNMIERFSFTSDGNSVDTGQDLLRAIYYGSSTGASSTTHGYTCGGWVSSTVYNEISKFQFNASSNATDVGDMTRTRQSPAQCNSETDGYVFGGSSTPTSGAIERFSFSSDANSVAHGNSLAGSLVPGMGAASRTHGYYAGTYTGGGTHFVIEKWAFGSGANSTDVGDLTASTYAAYCSGSSSSTHGYRHGGGEGGNSTETNVIDRWSFATDGNATDVGDLTSNKGNCGGASSTTHGYSLGGDVADIDKYAYASSGNATDIGNLAAHGSDVRWCTGNQV